MRVGPVERDASDRFLDIDNQHDHSLTSGPPASPFRYTASRPPWKGIGRSPHVYILKTPKRVSSAAAFMAAEIPSARTMRVSGGSITPSSQSRAVL